MKRLPLVFAALLALLLALVVARAPQAGSESPTLLSFEEFQPTYQYRKAKWHRVKAALCRDHAAPHRWPSAIDVSPNWRDERLGRLHRRIAYAKQRGSACIPTSTTGIIRYVFPAATEDAALRVAYCETGGTYDPGAYNSSSGASGLFQLMPFHWEGRFNPFDPWANTRYAYRLSGGGYDWGAWVCKP